MTTTSTNVANRPDFGNFTTNEMEFMAEDIMITIIPRFRHDILHFICGDFGPFLPNTNIEVPLWLAIYLFKRNRCELAIPEWMSREKLEFFLQNERETESSFEPLPYHYLEISSIILNNIPKKNIPDCDDIRTLLEDIENVRMEKLRNGIQQISDKVQREGESILCSKLNNVGALEIKGIRKFLTGALNTFHVLNNADNNDNNNDNNGSSNSNGISNDGMDSNNVGRSEPPRRLRRFRGSN